MSLETSAATLDEKLRSLRARLHGLSRVAIAFSGGTDSSLLLKVAADELGENVIALIIVSPVLPQRERSHASDLAGTIGANLIEVEGAEMGNELFLMNAADRCYHCKRLNLALLKRKAAAMGFLNLLDGTNADDAKSSRPGLKALHETGTLSPLAEAGLSKEEVRQLAKMLELTNWDKPSSPCLSSRIPFGERITIEKLSMLEKAEDTLHDIGLGQLRVRIHGNVARIEVPPEDFAIVLSKREDIVASVKKAGFRYVSLDLEGYRSGSLELA